MFRQLIIFLAVFFLALAGPWWLWSLGLAGALIFFPRFYAGLILAGWLDLIYGPLAKTPNGFAVWPIFTLALIIWSLGLLARHQLFFQTSKT